MTLKTEEIINAFQVSECAHTQGEGLKERHLWKCDEYASRLPWYFLLQKIHLHYFTYLYDVAWIDFCLCLRSLFDFTMAGGNPNNFTCLGEEERLATNANVSKGFSIPKYENFGVGDFHREAKHLDRSNKRNSKSKYRDLLVEARATESSRQQQSNWRHQVSKHFT